MNKISGLCLALMTCFTGNAFSADGTDAPNLPIERYTYSMKLDIAKVISMSDVQDVCGVVPVHMIYEDSSGIRHNLEYQVMGNGCTGG